MRLWRYFSLLLGLSMPVLVLYLLPFTPPGETLALSWVDFLYTARGTESPPDDIVVVAIDEPSFQELGLKWPWPRTIHAELVRTLKREGALLVAFDVMFVEPSDDTKEDLEFASAMKETGNVIIGASISQIMREGFVQSIFVTPLEILSESCAQVGIVNFFPDPDGIIRRGMLVIQGAPTLAFSAALPFVSEKVALDPEDLESQPPFLIDFAGPSGTIKTVSYYQALRPEKYLPPGFFQGKVVFVGLSSDAAVEVQRGAVDAFPTPFFRFSKKAMFGVEIHANAARTIIEGFPIREINDMWLFALFALVTVAPFFVRNYPLRITGLTLLLVTSMICISIWLFIAHKIMLNVAVPVLSTVSSGLWWGVAGYIQTFREKRMIRGAFNKYVPPEVVEEVLKRPNLLRLGGEKRELTVLFSDIRGFTTLSENIDAEKLVSVLNLYLDTMTQQVFKYHGLLDKYIGDAIMALFGAPLPRDDHAVCACRTALSMLYALEKVGDAWEEVGLPRPRIGIGINSGHMVVGNMGSSLRFDYTVIGDEVNLASRLEGLNKLYGTSIIIGENTRKLLKGHEFVLRELDMVRVKGKEHPVRIYELMLVHEGDEPEAFITVFEEALADYRHGRWKNALHGFKEALSMRENDRPSAIFIERCVKLLKKAPESWDGVWTMTTK